MMWPSYGGKPSKVLEQVHVQLPLAKTEPPKTRVLNNIVFNVRSASYFPTDMSCDIFVINFSTLPMLSPKQGYYV